MTNAAREMARRFAVQHIAYWRESRGLPRTRALARRAALWWMAAAKGRVQ